MPGSEKPRQASRADVAQEGPRASSAAKATLALGGLTGLVLIIRLALVRTYTFDEMLHAHLTWLVSVGEVPYRDFAVNHFPFLWIVVAPFVKLLPEVPGSLEALRGLAILWNAIFLGSLAALICRPLQPKERLWALACFGLVVFSPSVIPYLIEYRPDPLGNALLFAGLFLFHARGGDRRFLFLGGFLAGSAVLINTKCIFFPAVLGMMACAINVRRYRELWPQALATAAGFGFAVLFGAGLMAALRMPLGTAWRMVIVYNAAIEKLHTQGFGLAHAIAEHPYGLGFSAMGLAALVYLLIKQRRLPDLLSLAILGFLVVNLLGNTRPWKQYYVPWLLLAGFFPARALPVLLSRLGGKLQVMAALLLALVAGIEFSTHDTKDTDYNHNLPEQTQTIGWMLEHVPRNGYVVAAFDRHPVFRRDSFFKSDVDLMNNGQDAIQEYMPQFLDATMAEQFSSAGCLRQLEARPPSVIVPRSCTRQQGDALEAYLKGHTGNYAPTNLPGVSLPVVVRR